MSFFYQKKTKKFYAAKLVFWSFVTFFGLTTFWSGAKQRFCFRESMSVLDQNGRIQALGFLSWLCPLQVTLHITTFLRHSHFFKSSTGSSDRFGRRVAQRGETWSCWLTRLRLNLTERRTYFTDYLISFSVVHQDLTGCDFTSFSDKVSSNSLAFRFR